MPIFVTPEEIEEARQMDALTYLRQFEPHELVPFASGVYTTRAHDSLKIKEDGRWYWWSRRTGGHTALDYLVNVNNLSLPEAVTLLTGKGARCPPRGTVLRRGVTAQQASKQYLPPARASPGGFTMPRPHGDNKRVFAYLTSRGIDAEIINHCIKHKLLYEDAEHHNAVFVGYDAGGIARYATKRGTASNSTFVGDVDLSDKRFCFSLKPEAPASKLYLFECAIDALSFATLLKMHGKPWRDRALLSLGGAYKQRGGGEDGAVPIALSAYLQRNPATSRIILCLDNDDVGHGAARLIQKLITDREVKPCPPKKGKDYNEYLHILKGIGAKAAMRKKEGSR